MRQAFLFFVANLLMMAMLGCQSATSDRDYFDQDTPGLEPILFAPDVVNTDSIEINAVFNDDMTELFFTRIIGERFVLHHSERIGEGWTVPTPIQMYADQTASSLAIDPSPTPDGRTIYFLGIGPEDRVRKALPDVYRSDKVDGIWQLATRVETPISTDTFAESYPVVVEDGSIYFESDRPGGFGRRDIYRAQSLGGGQFAVPVNIGPVVNSTETARSTYVSRDENVLIMANTSKVKKGFDVAFKVDGQWQAPVYIEFDQPLDQKWSYCCPYLSPDGKYFFFSRRYSDPPGSGWKGVVQGEVLWVDSEVIFRLQP